ncbi:MAG TPA: lysine--tRNA ligase, partial [Planctomycetaceae bacterium]|nr:lysine--tRNA ligase [Planctomycetaceae bacterium]
HLKRLMVGGVERVFEIGRVFRNEGIDATHNPEFTMIEIYQAYGDYQSMMDLVEKIVVDATEVLGEGMVLPWGDEQIDFTPPWPRRTYAELFLEHAGCDIGDTPAVTEIAKRLEIETDGVHPDVVVNKVFEETVEDALRGPIFVTDYPASLCPLTKRKSDNPEIAERFELFIHG